MKPKGPIITLAAGLVVAAALMVININVTARRDAAAAAGSEVANGAAATEPSAPDAPEAPTPPPSVPAPPGTWAGTVSGGVSIAIATKDGEAIAYLCDGRNVEAWLHGSAVNGELTLSGSDGAELIGVYDEETAAGTVTVGGRSWDFSAATVRPPSGLYRATANVRNAEFVGGWIVVDGEQVGLGVLDGDVVAVPPVDPGSATVYIDGVGVAVHMVDGTNG